MSVFDTDRHNVLNDFLKLLESGMDNASLLLSIGNAYLKRRDMEQAREHLTKAVASDLEYSAAWKINGRTMQ